MYFNFRKVASVLASAVMLGSTVGFAAANYPGPFVKDGNADVAIVWGSNAANTDLVAVIDVTADLQVELAKQTATTGTTGTVTTTGETAALFEGSSKIYANTSLNSVKTVLTKSNLPTVLKDDSFSGNVDASTSQTITLGSNPVLAYSKAPTSSDDPNFVITMGTTPATQYLYNATVTFNKAVAFNHSDSKGADLIMFGQKYTVASATDGSNLVLLKTAEKVSLSSDTPTTTVTIAGKEYTIELVSASDTSATIKVTDSDGNTETKEINENASKKIQGVTIAITNADETNLKLSASVIAGAEKVTLTDGSTVTVGEDNKVIDGTLVSFVNTITTNNITQIRFAVAAPNSDKDAIKQGESFIDPISGSFKIDFSAGLNIPLNSSLRDEIKFTASGDDKMQITFTNHAGKQATQIWAKNVSGNVFLAGDNDAKNISVFERASTLRNEFIVVGNENTGHLVKVNRITNQSTGYSDDKVSFTDVFSGDTIDASITSEGSGTVVIGGKSYAVEYNGASTASEDVRTVRLNYPDSSGAGSAVAYPTIQTKRGAKVGFYEPLNITLSDWDAAGNILSTLRIPNGNGYTDITVAPGGTGDGNVGIWNFTFGSTTRNLNISGAAGATSGLLTVGRLTYNVTGAGNLATAGTQNRTNIFLQNGDGTNGNIATPAVVVFEEKDDQSLYNALVTTLEVGGVADDGLGINDVDRTGAAGGADSGSSDTLASNSKITRKADVFGSIISIDATDSDQQIATISYPDEQVYAQIYVAANEAAISSGGSTGDGTVKELGSVSVMDSEVDSVSSKNLIVVGGSCVNTVAATLLGSSSPLCGADFTAKTGIDSGFLIQTFQSPLATTKVATLVAGYNAGDTTNAAKYFTTQPVDTTVGKKYTGQTATSATLSTESTTNTTS